MRTVSFYNFKSGNFKLSVSNPKSKYVAYLSVLSQISNCQSLGRKNKHEILKTDRAPTASKIKVAVLSGSLFSGRPSRDEPQRRGNTIIIIISSSTTTITTPTTTTTTTTTTTIMNYYYYYDYGVATRGAHFLNTLSNVFQECLQLRLAARRFCLESRPLNYNITCYNIV